MPDLEASTLSDWWQAKPPALLAAVRRQEDRENRIAAEPEADSLVIRLGHALDRAKPDSATLAEPDSIPRLRLALAYMAPSRRLRCLHWFALERESLLQAILAAAPDGDLDSTARDVLRGSLSGLRQEGLLGQFLPPARLDFVNALLPPIQGTAP